MANQQTCRCSAYSFPHRIYGGKCDGDEVVESKPECICLWRPHPNCPIHGELYHQGLDFDGRAKRPIPDARRRFALWC